MSFPEADLTTDALLGGRVRLRQPRKGYRSATDPVLLAAAVSARPEQRVLDVGCGAGAVLLCLGARIEGLELHGLDLQPDYAELARLNAPGATIWDGDVAAPPRGLGEIGFDWVLTNPPFFDGKAAASPDKGRDAARREALPTGVWIAASLKRVRSGGRIAIIHLAEKLGEVFSGLEGAGDIAILPLVARAGGNAKRVIVTARKGAKGGARLASPLILHEGLRHERDEDDFSAAATAILRDGCPLTF